MDPRKRPHGTSLHRLAGFDYAGTDHPYFVTARARREAPFTDPRLCREVVGSLYWLRGNRGLRVYAFCLMPDHLHLLLRLGRPDQSLGDIMRAFKTFTTREGWSLGHEGALWQARFHDHVVRPGEDGHRIAEYIRDNPVRKGLVEKAEEFPWSGMPDPL